MGTKTMQSIALRKASGKWLVGTAILASVACMPHSHAGQDRDTGRKGAAPTSPGRPAATARYIGPMNSEVVRALRRRLGFAPLSARHDSPIVLQADSLATLKSDEVAELVATYDAGYSTMPLS